RWGQTRYRYNTNDQILHTLFEGTRPHEEQFSYDANGNLSQHLPGGWCSKEISVIAMMIMAVWWKKPNNVMDSARKSGATVGIRKTSSLTSKRQMAHAGIIATTLLADESVN
ncbi:hypothetical protein, partial [Xenorhabdus bovienii]